MYSPKRMPSLERSAQGLSKLGSSAQRTAAPLRLITAPDWAKECFSALAGCAEVMLSPPVAGDARPPKLASSPRRNGKSRTTCAAADTPAKLAGCRSLGCHPLGCPLDCHPQRSRCDCRTLTAAAILTREVVTETASIVNQAKGGLVLVARGALRARGAPPRLTPH